jgi:hypothetical protein
MDNKKTLTNDVEMILDYLREHPNLLVDHPEVLSGIVVPHPTGAATSLVERQVSVLREQIRQLKNQLKDLIEIARENGELSERLHTLTEKLVQTDDLGSLLLTIKKTILSEFKADRVILRLFVDPVNDAPEAIFTGNDWPKKPLFEEALNKKQPISGRLNQQQNEALFADELPEYSSSVLLPLEGKNWQGLLAIGSQDPQRFSADMGTEILAQMADIVILALNPYAAPNE